MDRQAKWNQLFYSRGPYYRKLCAMIADRVAALPPTLLGLNEGREKASYREGYIAGCRAVASVIRSIDNPSIELVGPISNWNKAAAND